MTAKKYSKHPSDKKLIFGVGINDADYKVVPNINGKPERCPFYRAWMNMLSRCYSPKHHIKYPSYADCTVCDEWLSFMSFRNWMILQDWKDKQLDKDILIIGNKVYSPEACIFVDKFINCLLSDRGNDRGKYPLGVSFHKQSGKYQSTMNKKGKQHTLGRYSTPEEANEKYREEKRLYILQVACCEPDIRVKQGLYRHSLLFKS